MDYLNGRVDVSVVLPVYNEAGHLETEIRRIWNALRASEFSFEIIVVDDASSDGSADVLNRMPNVRTIQLPENRGAGFARKVGTRAAVGNVVVWSDVDMTYPNDRIPVLVRELEGYDQVVGSRTTEEGTKKFLRKPAKLLIRILAQYLMQTPIPDLNSGFRAFRRDVVAQFLHLLPRGFSCVTTMTMTFLSNGYSVKYIPIEYRARAGYSKFHWWTDTKKYLRQVVRMVLAYEPMRFFLPLAISIGLIGVAKATFDVIGKDFRIATNTLLILFTSFNLLLIGFLADLIVQSTKRKVEVQPAVTEVPATSTVPKSREISQNVGQ